MSIDGNPPAIEGGPSPAAGGPALSENSPASSQGNPGSSPTERRPVRVLSLIKGLGPGGAEQLLLLALTVSDPARVRHQVAFVRADKTHLVPEFQAIGIEPVLLGTGGRRQAVTHLRRVMSQVDVVHVHSPVLAATARLLSRTLRPGRRPAVVTTEHNEWTSHRRPTRVANALTAPLDTHTWAVSDQVRETVWRPLRRRYEVLIHGIDTEATTVVRPRDEVRRELGVEPCHLVVTVANLRRNKDYPNLLRAAVIACEAEPRLHIAAIGQGPLAQEIAALRDDLGLRDRVSLLGYRRDVRDVLGAGDSFVLASAHEGLPVAVMEAFAAGLPVVATRVGGVPGQVRDGIEGLLVDPGDPQALAMALLRMAREEPTRARMAASARARALDYDIRRAVAAQTTAYERLGRRPD